MKRTLLYIIALVLTITVGAQTLKVTTANGTYQYPASEMTEHSSAIFTGGTTLTIGNDVFNISDITDISVISNPSSDVEDNTVNIVYSGTTATVTMADNVMPYVTATVSGAHVTITQSNTADIDGDEITYVLSGSSSDGEFALGGSYKCTISLAGVSLTNPSGPAINITNKKRIQISAKNGTENTLTDGADANESWKGCIYSKGQLQLQGKGSLTVNGNTKHGIKSGDYITVKNLTLNVKSTVGDGISCNKYFVMNSGTVTISGAGDDGIQCDLEEDDDATGETTDHEDENSGNIYILDGTITVNITAAAAKGIKSEGDLNISGGTVNVTTTGNGAYDSSEKDAKGSSCLKSDGNMSISGGTLTLKSTGTGGKGIKADGTLNISDGTISATTTGSQYRYSNSLTASPKAIKSDGAMTISGGEITASSGNHEGIETKSTLTISGGYVYSYASDDAINSASDFTITGGYVMGNSSGNDGLDANGNMYIKGGNVFAVATSQPEVGIDANTEGGKQLYITGGNIVAIGGFENGASVSGGTAKSASYSKGTWYGLYNGSTLAFAFKVPSNSKMGTSMAVYITGTPSLMSGVSGSGTSFWSGNGYTSASGGSSVSLSNYSSGGNSGGGPGGGPGGGGGGWHW